MMGIDDQILAHPKFVRAVRSGGWTVIAMWLGLRCYCAQKLTDGFIPTDMLDEARGPKGKARACALDALSAVGLIHTAEQRAECLACRSAPHATDGYWMHDYLQWSESRSQAQERRRIDGVRSALRSNSDLMSFVKTRDGNRCRYCGAPVDWKARRGPLSGTYDHVVPLSKGGDNAPENIVVACRACNSRKKDRLLADTGMVLLGPTSKLPESDQVISGPNPLQSKPIHKSPPNPLRPREQKLRSRPEAPTGDARADLKPITLAETQAFIALAAKAAGE